MEISYSREEFLLAIGKRPREAERVRLLRQAMKADTEWFVQSQEIPDRHDPIVNVFVVFGKLSLRRGDSRTMTASLISAYHALDDAMLILEEYQLVVGILLRVLTAGDWETGSACAEDVRTLIKSGILDPESKVLLPALVGANLAMALEGKGGFGLSDDDREIFLLRPINELAADLHFIDQPDVDSVVDEVCRAHWTTLGTKAGLPQLQLTHSVA